MNRSIALLILCGLFFVSCKEEDTVTPITQLPREFKLIAEAQGSNSEGSTVDCRLDLNFELRREEQRTELQVRYAGVHGGEAFRRVLTKDEAGFAFFIDVFAPVDVYLYTESGQLFISIPVNQTAEGRFYQQMSSFSGKVNADGTGSGNWVCAPLDIDQNGYLDNELTAHGTWRIEPSL